MAPQTVSWTPAEAAEWEAVVREPLTPDAPLDDALPADSAAARESVTTAVVAPPLLRLDPSPSRLVAPTPAPAQGPPALTRLSAIDHPERHYHQLEGETAQNSLLRTPSGVSPVADDFFDSLIRRVEGDR